MAMSLLASVLPLYARRPDAAYFFKKSEPSLLSPPLKKSVVVWFMLARTELYLSFLRLLERSIALGVYSSKAVGSSLI